MISNPSIYQIFNRLWQQNPEPVGELEHHNLYTLLVAVVLSAQATDKGVNLATRSLFTKIKTPQDMLDLGLEVLTAHIASIGLYRAKAKNIMALSQILVKDHVGKVPSNREALMALPGVGRKTANVVLNIGWQQPVMAVDTHVFRLSHRLGLSKGKTVELVEEDLMRVIPAEFMLHAHHWLILHGRYICQARKPKCGICIIADLCSFEGKQL